MDTISEKHGVDQAATGLAGAEAVVSVRGLVKRYGSREAVAGLDLEVRRGEIFAVLGPNGAGKTVTELRHSLAAGTVDLPSSVAAGVPPPAAVRDGHDVA